VVMTYHNVWPDLHMWVDGADSGNMHLPVATYRQLQGLIGRTYLLQAGHTYRITSDSAFIAYESSFYGASAAGHVQHGDVNSFFFSCATPISGRYPALPGEQPQAGASMNCDASWTITAKGSRYSPLGLATVLRDPHGAYIRLAPDSGYTSSNIASSGPLLTPGATLAEFRVAVANPLANAEAWIQVQNSLGNDTILHLSYTAPLLSQSVDTVSFDNSPVGIQTCERITYKNIGSSASDSVRLTALQHSLADFTVSTSRPLPLTLGIDDSVDVTVCHIGKVESLYDTLHLLLGFGEALTCGEARVPIRSVSAKTTMTANDYNFRSGIVGVSYPRRIAIMNTGNANLLVSAVQHSGSASFTFTDTARLPHMLEPGTSIELGFLYKPVVVGYDTAYFTWLSNAEGSKTRSRMTGKGLSGGLEWSDSLLTLDTRNRSTDTIRLVNPVSTDFGGPIAVESLNISGPDALDFSVDKNELGYYPLQSFPVAPEEAVWFTIAFHPDTSLSRNDRHALLTANDLTGYHPEAMLLGKIGTAAVTEHDLSGISDQTFSISQYEHSLTVNLNEGLWHIAVYDLLGRSVIATPSIGEHTTLDLTSLRAGTYIVRASNGIRVLSRTFQTGK
jgi:hypothetical protein